MFTSREQISYGNNMQTTDDSEERTDQKGPSRVDQRKPQAEGTFDLS